MNLGGIPFPVLPWIVVAGFWLVTVLMIRGARQDGGRGCLFYLFLAAVNVLVLLFAYAFWFMATIDQHIAPDPEPTATSSDA